MTRATQLELGTGLPPIKAAKDMCQPNGCLGGNCPRRCGVVTIRKGDPNVAVGCAPHDGVATTFSCGPILTRKLLCMMAKDGASGAIVQLPNGDGTVQVGRSTTREEKYIKLGQFKALDELGRLPRQRQVAKVV